MSYRSHWQTLQIQWSCMTISWQLNTRETLLMPRPWFETITDFPDLTDKPYACCVVDVVKHHSPLGIRVILEHTGSSQLGRRHEAILPLPCRPSGPTSEFFRACRLDVEVGSSVKPTQCVGKVVLVRFKRTESGYQPITFACDTLRKAHSQSTQGG